MMWCSYCGSDKHTLANCPKTWGGQANRTAMRCSYCGHRDHNVAACSRTWGGAAPKPDDYIKDADR